MKKIIITCIICFSALYLWGELQVDREEITKGKEISFVNYNGPYLYYYTLEEIRGIGIFLGKNIAKISSRATFNSLYSIIHVYDTEDTTEKLNADIFVIEPGAFLDHIRNLRVILAGFLESAYGYSYDDALLIAKFVTYYNATFRGEINYFQERYKAAVLKHLSAADAGLATSYSEWPGKTKVLIPLNENGEKGSPDTSEIASKEVIEDLKKSEDKGVEDRKDMVEFQEKELEEAEKKLAEDKKALEEDKKSLEEDKKKLDEDKKSGKLSEKEITEREAEIKEKETAIKEKEKDITGRSEEVKKKEETIKKTREDIATDERSLPADKKSTEHETSATISDTVSLGKALFLTVKDGSEDTAGEMVLLDFKADKVLARSVDIKIKERKFYIFADALLVIAEPKSEARNYLMLLDPNTLAVRVQGKDEVFARSIVLTASNNVFAVIKKGSGYYVGKFDGNLKLITASQEEINPLTPLFLAGNSLFAQSKRGKVLLLATHDLTLQKAATVP